MQRTCVQLQHLIILDMGGICPDNTQPLCTHNRVSKLLFVSYNFILKANCKQMLNTAIHPTGTKRHTALTHD